MTKKINKNIIKKYTLVLILIISIFAIIKFFSNNLLFLPKGEIIETLISQDNKHTMNAYIIDGGSLSANAIRVEIINNKTKKVKNIYWSYPENEVEIKWIDNETVIINNIKLNIYKDTYNKNE